jgi:16S rRNA (cytosine1402-N4)-methyltransferase
MNKSHQDDQKHTPVMLEAVLNYLAPRAGEAYLDATAGYGGHAHAILERTLTPQKAVLVDRDEEAVSSLRQRFKPSGTEIIHSDFLSASQKLQSAGRQFDMILADLGVSSPQLNSAQRGFAIKLSGPIDMRMDQAQQLSAESLVNSVDEAKLAELLRTYGQEPKARAIARRIVAARPVKTTEELARIVSGAWWRGKSRIHPATRTFQALRIAVNGELAQLETCLPLWLEMLKPGGRLTVISFHSLEDRIVKSFLAENSGNLDSQLILLTKRPVTADASEIVSNPRAHSAKLRAAAKIKTKRKDRTPQHVH